MSSRPARSEEPVAKTRRRLAHLLAIGAMRAAVAAAKDEERASAEQEDDTTGQEPEITSTWRRDDKSNRR